MVNNAIFCTNNYFSYVQVKFKTFQADFGKHLHIYFFSSNYLKAQAKSTVIKETLKPISEDPIFLCSSYTTAISNTSLNMRRHLNYKM